MLCTTENSVSNQRPSVSLSHHVGVGSAGHALTSVEVEEFVDLWGGQSVSNFQLLDDEHLPGERLLTTGTDPDHRCCWPLPILPRYCHRVGLMLERHLEDKTGDTCWDRGTVICLYANMYLKKRTFSNQWYQCISVPWWAVSPSAGCADGRRLQPSAKSSAVERRGRSEKVTHGRQRALNDLCREVHPHTQENKNKNYKSDKLCTQKFQKPCMDWTNHHTNVSVI